MNGEGAWLKLNMGNVSVSKRAVWGGKRGGGDKPEQVMDTCRNVRGVYPVTSASIGTLGLLNETG